MRDLLERSNRSSAQVGVLRSEAKQLDLQLRPVLQASKEVPCTPALEAELKLLKQSHQHAYSALSSARNKVKQHIDSTAEQKERILAYQLAMDME